MKGNVFSNMVSITNGLHRDNRSEREFDILNSELKKLPKANNAVFKVNFKRPLNSKKEYYFKLISNDTETELAGLKPQFPTDATEPENKYNYTVQFNKFNKYLKDIASYIKKHSISNDLGNDTDYIINYLKVSAIRLYVELQEQYGQFSETPLFTISDIAEKYFNDTKFDKDLIKKVETSKKVVIKRTSKHKSKPKTSFVFKGKDKSNLLKVLEQLQIKIDLLENRTTTKQLFEILTTDDFTSLNFNIYFEANTTAIRYIFDKLKPQFKNIKLSEIERSNKFYTKNDFELTAQNLSSSKQYTFKEKETIDNIFKQMQ